MDIFTLLLCLFLVLWGISAFIGERMLIVIAAICAIVAGVIGLVRLLA